MKDCRSCKKSLPLRCFYSTGAGPDSTRKDCKYCLSRKRAVEIAAKELTRRLASVTDQGRG